MVDFAAVLNHVLGQALAAAQYQLEDTPMHHARGLFRYQKRLSDSAYRFIEFQNLYHADLSRFQITLLKNSLPDARAATPDAVEKTLSSVIWNEYGARVLPAENHWWPYKYDLPSELYAAGKLLFAYGLPWLEGG